MPSTVSSTQIVAEMPSPVSELTKDKEQQAFETDQFPEGGAAAWCAVLGAFLVQCCGIGYSMSFGVYQAFYTLHYLHSEPPSAISWIGGLNVFLTCSVGLFSGMLYDRGYFYHLLIGGSLLQSCSLFVLSLAQPGQYFQIFLAQGVGLGLGQGLVFVPSIAIASHYFRKRRTLAMTLLACGSPLGSIIHPIMLNYLFNQSVGFAKGVRISAALNSILLFISCLLMRTRLEPPKHPASYLAVGKGIIHDLPFCLMSVSYLVFQSALFFPMFYLQLDSVEHGNPQTFSFYSLALLNGGNLLGRLTSGFIASRVGVPRLIIISTVACSILIFGMIGLNGVPTVIILGMSIGYFIGLYYALAFPLVAFLTVDMSEFGARMGVGMTVSGFGNLVGGPISGAILTSRYKWLQSSLYNGLIALVGSSLLICMEFVRRRRLRSIANPAKE